MKPNITIRGAACFIAAGLASAAIAQDIAPPLPTGAVGESAIPANLEPPLANPRDFQGVWLPAARNGGQGGPGGNGPAGNAGPPGAGGPPSGPGGGAPGGGGAPPGGSGGGTQSWCRPNQVAFGAGAGFTFGIIQSPTTMVLLNEENQNYRVIHIGGKHPAEILPTRNGHSIATWEGNTLVVDTTGVIGQDGKASTAHTTERVKKSADGSQLIIESSGRTTTLQWRPDNMVSESVCEEGYDQFTIKDGIVVLSKQVKSGEKK